jgi:hypothetical protein
MLSRQAATSVTSTETIIMLHHMIAGTRITRVPGFEVHDVKSRARDHGITGRAQAATCLFCNRTLVSWPGRPATRRNPRSTPEALEAATRTHTPGCAEQWMWTALARWSTGFATPAEAAAIATWREQVSAAEAVIARLPAPPHSELAHALEVVLILISRIWSY